MNVGYQHTYLYVLIYIYIFITCHSEIPAVAGESDSSDTENEPENITRNAESGESGTYSLVDTLVASFLQRILFIPLLSPLLYYSRTPCHPHSLSCFL